jgi:choline kinase
MKAVILAAGVGSRLGELTIDKPKALLEIHGTPLIDYQIDLLIHNGFVYEDIYIVSGYESSTMGYLFAKGINEIYNAEYETKNNIYSLYLVKYLKDDILIVNSDVYFHQNILKIFLESGNDTAISVDMVKELGDEEMKVILDRENVLRRIGKELDPGLANGEYIGISRISLDDSALLYSSIETLLSNGNEHYWYEHAFQEMVDRGGKILGVETEGYPWIEIDTVEDYEKSQSIL